VDGQREIPDRPGRGIAVEEYFVRRPPARVSHERDEAPRHEAPASAVSLETGLRLQSAPETSSPSKGMRITGLDVNLGRAPDTGCPHWVSHFVVPRANEIRGRLYEVPCDVTCGSGGRT